MGKKYIYFYVKVHDIICWITGVPVQVPHSRENSVPPAVQTPHSTNISNIEVSVLTLLPTNSNTTKVIKINGHYSTQLI